MKTYVTLGFHSDVVWLEDQRDYAISLLSDLRQNIVARNPTPTTDFLFMN